MAFFRPHFLGWDRSTLLDRLRKAMNQVDEIDVQLAEVTRRLRLLEEIGHSTEGLDHATLLLNSAAE